MKHAPTAISVAVGVFVWWACGGSAPPPPPVTASAGPPVASSPQPDPDRDHDGVPNECDACPDQPETMNGICDEDGCPDVAIDAFPHELIAIQPVVLFDKQSTKISGIAQPLIDQVAHLMVINKDALELVAVVGHASRDEADAETTALARATAVRQALVARGVDDRHLESHGAGSRRPFDEKDEPLNRRVQFVVVRAEGRQQYRFNGDAIEQLPAPEATAPQCKPRPPTCGK